VANIRAMAKQIVAFMIYYTGIFDFILFVNSLKGRSVTIVTFHRVGGGRCPDMEYSLPNLSISEESFEEVIRFFQRRFNPISFPDLLHATQNQGKILRNPIVVTFDDGYEDNYTHAFPVLEKFRVPATFFLTSSFVDSNKTFWWDRMFHALVRMKPRRLREDVCAGGCPDRAGNGLMKRLTEEGGSEERYDGEEISAFIAGLWSVGEEKIHQALVEVGHAATAETREFSSNNRMLSWSQVREMKDSGMTFGSHSRTHVNLNHLTKSRLMEELLLSKREIERNLEEEINFFAYPGGSFSDGVKDAVVECGYRCACSTESGVNDMETNVFGLKRINIWQGAVSGMRGTFSKSLLALHLLRQSRNRVKCRQ